MREAAEVTAADEFGDKVLHLTDGTYLKLFRVKRWFTSARIWPYSARFVSGVQKLEVLGIPTLKVIEAYRIPSLDRTAVHYHPLPGKTLRELPDGVDEPLAEQLGCFINQLHDKGVYLRSMHLGNVVLTPDGDLGLIDVADMKIYARSLPERLRLRNFQHLVRYQNDRAVIAAHLSGFLAAFTLSLAGKLEPMFAPDQVCS